jgi:hypothetical protein
MYPNSIVQRKQFWQAVGGIAELSLIGAFVLAALCVICGCQPTGGPTTNPVAAPAQQAITHSEAAKGAIEQAKPEASPTGKRYLQVAVEHTTAAIAAEKQVVAAADALAQAKADSDQRAADLVEHYEGKLAERDKAIADRTEERDEARQKYHDSWLGGKTWRLIGWVSGIGALLTIAGLLLNAKTDWFVYVWDFAVTLLTGALKAIFGVGGRIAGLFEKAKSKPETSKQ